MVKSTVWKLLGDDRLLEGLSQSPSMESLGSPKESSKPPTGPVLPDIVHQVLDAFKRLYEEDPTELPEMKDVLNLVLAKGYLAKLIENDEVSRYIQHSQPDVFSEFVTIVETVSLDK